MGKLWDEFKTALGDQARGSMKYGASTSVGHNYRAMKAARDERESREYRLGQAAADRALGEAYRHAKRQRGKRDFQFDHEGFKVKVTNGHDRRRNQYTTDIIIVDPRDRTGHWHFIVDEWGNEILNEWRDNH
ncbi:MULTISPECIES: hypothetical protein [Mycobacteroides]|uniref:hypothetical protein n=1 Tax=Mycobacteroides TaxID=670516 RepID=UPI0009934CB2|nr:MULTISPECIES: hypothetical protein [Mycobacteroides]SKK72036.1 Uncharacterised protein [Mycobacteroides abscessus subsp. massiliense]SKL19222.1 Uncharacterised protein [Mycobacteroides abscessus subsp. massiliense]SKL77996.1 Uncharacterised protein [Mycobacteroides abscessus subsp. massiliense]SKM91355.1 Uncharacterised protein [Mycobacteroides abscessus subsp. massiliense]SKO47510.1 Uncharacterised protein [Mycobacteroides abscessus subsp. massiliense]